MVIVAMTPRSGSGYLSDLMKLNNLGQSAEHFRVSGGTMEKLVTNSKLKTYDAYVRKIIQSRSQGNIFAAKCDWPQFVPLYYFGSYDAYFRQARFVYLTRGDLLMQAISRYIGTATGYFHSTNKDKAHTLDQEVAMDFDAITQHLTHLVNMQSAWETFFSTEGISPLRLRYEELEADPVLTIRRIADFIGRPVTGDVITQTEHEKVRNERNEKLRDAYVNAARMRRNQASQGLLELVSK
ncbi:MAG TPA: Stf0 family sulfotransferase [Rhizomicrobium sp.]